MRSTLNHNFLRGDVVAGLFALVGCNSGEPLATASGSTSGATTAMTVQESESGSSSTEGSTTSGTSGASITTATASTTPTSDTTTESSTGTDSTTSGTTTGGVDPSDSCAPLAFAEGPTIEVTPEDAASLPQTVLDAAPGTTLLLADGVYNLTTTLHFTKDGVSLRSASGERNAVILDGGYSIGEIALVQASDITIADMTLQRAQWHPIHVTGASDHTIEGVVIYNVAVIDPGQQAIKINAVDDTYFSDYGTIACSRVEMTDAGRSHVDNCYTGGIDAHAALGWVIRDNRFEGFWCESGLSEHAIHFWVGGRDTLVERNQIIDCARGVGFGLGAQGNGKSRDYDDDPCPGATYLGHVDGTIRNNMIFAGRPELFASGFGVDSGVALEQACGAVVRHNTVVSLAQPFVSMEYRFANTNATIENNLVSHTIIARDGGQANLAGNIEAAGDEHFADAAAGDLHLAPNSVAIDAGEDVGVNDDVDRDARDQNPDIGADEQI